jgi:hypothetical protein
MNSKRKAFLPLSVPVRVLSAVHCTLLMFVVVPFYHLVSSFVIVIDRTAKSTSFPLIGFAHLKFIKYKTCDCMYFEIR